MGALRRSRETSGSVRGKRSAGRKELLDRDNEHGDGEWPAIRMEPLQGEAFE